MRVDLNQMMQVAIQHAVADALSERERADRDAAVITDLRAKHPGVPLYKSHVDEALLVFRPPTKAVWSAVETANTNGAPQSKVVLDLVRGCILHPSWDAVEDLAEHRPALLAKLASECTKLAGRRRRAQLQEGAVTPRTALPLLGPWAPTRAAITVTYHDGRTEDVTEEELRERFGARVTWNPVHGRAARGTP